MPNSFQQADAGTVGAMAEVLLQKYHVDLFEVRAKIDCVFAFRDPDATAPAIMTRGHRVLGQARINNLKHRVLGLGDAEILLDGDAWADMSEAQQNALLDHELEHFEVRRHPKTGEFLYDDINRPMLRLRFHDREFGFFDNIASRHGVASCEIRNLAQMFHEAGDDYIPNLKHGIEDLGGSELLRALAEKRKSIAS